MNAEILTRAKAGETDATIAGDQGRVADHATGPTHETGIIEETTATAVMFDDEAGLRHR